MYKYLVNKLCVCILVYETNFWTSLEDTIALASILDQSSELFLTDLAVGKDIKNFDEVLALRAEDVVSLT